MDLEAIVNALFDRPSKGPRVLLKVLLASTDEVDGEVKILAQFVRASSMPVELARPDVRVEVEIGGEQHFFKSTCITWFEKHNVCMVEFVWPVRDDMTLFGKMKADNAWHY